MFVLLFLMSIAWGSAQDRCSTTNCMCAVTHDNEQESPYVVQVYFDEDAYEVSPRYVSELRVFQYQAIVYAMTDGCGSHKHNTALASRRASAVAKYLHGATKYNVPEATSNHHSEARQVLVIPRQSKWLNFLAAHPADIYLLDASGSMAGHWEQIKHFPFPKHSKVFVAKTHGCRDHQSVLTIDPGGDTEYLLPYYMVLKNAPPGSTITVITDGKSTHPSLPHETRVLLKLIKEKNLTVYAL